GSLRARCEERTSPVPASPKRCRVQGRALPGSGAAPRLRLAGQQLAARFSSTEKGRSPLGRLRGEGSPTRQAGHSQSRLSRRVGGRQLLSPSPFLIPTGRAPRGKATPEGTPTLPLLRAPGRAGIRRRGEQQTTVAAALPKPDHPIGRLARPHRYWLNAGRSSKCFEC